MPQLAKVNAIIVITASSLVAALAITSLGFSKFGEMTAVGENSDDELVSPLAENRQDDVKSNPGLAGESFPIRGYVAVSVVRDGLEIYHHEDHNIITDAGKDFASAQLGSTSTSSNGANYVALSSDSGAPDASDTALTGEISSSGLDRAQGTYSHTAGTNTFIVENAFTATGSVSNIQKAGLFTAATGGTLLAENTFSSVDLISSDMLTITWTITIG
jgi:hypothetical protein